MLNDFLKDALLGTMKAACNTGELDLSTVIMAATMAVAELASEIGEDCGEDMETLFPGGAIVAKVDDDFGHPTEVRIQVLDITDDDDDALDEALADDAIQYGGTK